MLSFSEKQIVDRLQPSPRVKSKMFSALCAQRLLPGYQIFQLKTSHVNAYDLTSLLIYACDYIADPDRHSGDAISENIIILDKAIEAIESADWLPEQAAAEDAAASIYYTYRCLQNEEPQEAAWSARRAYSAVDDYVCIQTSEINDAKELLEHPIIQRELSRQDRDILDLLREKQSFENLLLRAQQESADFLPWYSANSD